MPHSILFKNNRIPAPCGQVTKKFKKIRKPKLKQKECRVTITHRDVQLDMISRISLCHDQPNTNTVKKSRIENQELHPSYNT